ncbi:Uncharacterised protein [Vibrio cholerae]|nr:Uncharacterised protein [Vibrio cholerae]
MTSPSIPARHNTASRISLDIGRLDNNSLLSFGKNR